MRKNLLSCATATVATTTPASASAVRRLTACLSNMDIPLAVYLKSAAQCRTAARRWTSSGSAGPGAWHRVAEVVRRPEPAVDGEPAIRESLRCAVDAQHLVKAVGQEHHQPVIHR